ncbi:endonuclease/exonuclease/phosphatase family protein [uncultured Pseudokineococcus sp.]|uniref:endonuclease/exonuclease/phosphatase family protein n=1 Tax=uncultured Pseudokineococcus sp. TaxID=1642928 RepID=UPI00260ED5A9|nr:endonuclease/exonuclease/phosphatase family protein [uncultured Pseudokineococcus sp.]
MTTPRHHRPWSLLAALASLVVAAVAVAPGASAEPRREVSLLQMNLCLSGFAGCFGDTAYPAVLDEAVLRVREHAPDAVSLNEACSGDAERLGEQTGYEVAFTTVVYGGAPLPCRTPEGRGVFGNAVLTRDAQVRRDEAPFASQLGSEERRWLCVTTTRDVTTCTTHLAVAGSPGATANQDAQCRELAEVMAAQGLRRAVLVAGDVNRRTDCAPVGAWTRTDAAAEQLPGIQHVMGTLSSLAPLSTEVVPMTRTDHDALLVTSRLRG